MTLNLISATAAADKTALVRVDFNVPLQRGSTDGIADDRRIRQAIPTLELLLKAHAKVVIMSHLGRPTAAKEPEFSLKPIAHHLEKLLKVQVVFVPDCVGDVVNKAVEAAPLGSVVLLENLRFHPEEEKNDSDFAHQLAGLADIYVNEAFSVSHRAHASVAVITKYLPAYAGLNLAAEVKALASVRDNPTRPLVAVIGGAKISDKVEAIVNLAHIADVILIGGGVANNFLKADGLPVHESYLQDAPADLKKKGIDYIHVAKDLLEKMKNDKVLIEGFIPVPKILYPIDVVAASSMDSSSTHIVDLTQPSAETAHAQSQMYLDIGPKTIQLYAEICATAKTIFWNGPMGVWEKTDFAHGTKQLATTIAEQTGQHTHTVLGGGDTLAAVDHFHLSDKYSYLSTAGGASLDFLAGKPLPGLLPLMVHG